MIGLAIIVVPAGIIAALILFRWARTLLIFGIAALVIWAFVHGARAQEEEPMVRCRTGSVVFTASRSACHAFVDGSRKLRYEQHGGNPGILECSRVVAHDLGWDNDQLRFVSQCQEMWRVELDARVDAAWRQQR